eukprot:6207288-Pleurochrysis_carterae.AAC.1
MAKQGGPGEVKKRTLWMGRQELLRIKQEQTGRYKHACLVGTQTETQLQTHTRARRLWRDMAKNSSERDMERGGEGGGGRQREREGERERERKSKRRRGGASGREGKRFSAREPMSAREE